jgi:hypothetical protein
MPTSLLYCCRDNPRLARDHQIERSGVALPREGLDAREELRPHNKVGTEAPRAHRHSLKTQKGRLNAAP